MSDNLQGGNHGEAEVNISLHLEIHLKPSRSPFGRTDEVVLVTYPRALAPSRKGMFISYRLSKEREYRRQTMHYSDENERNLSTWLEFGSPMPADDLRVDAFSTSWHDEYWSNTGELLLVTHFIVRQFANLGYGNKWSNKIASDILSASSNHSLVSKHFSSVIPKRASDYRAEQGGMSIAAAMSTTSHSRFFITDLIQNECEYTFYHYTRGFHWFSLDIGRYAHEACIALIRGLSDRGIDDLDYLRLLELVLLYCSQAYQQQSITVENQMRVSADILRRAIST
jgi:hypothetical protein